MYKISTTTKKNEWTIMTAESRDIYTYKWRRRRRRKITAAIVCALYLLLVQEFEGLESVLATDICLTERNAAPQSYYTHQK